MMDYQQTVDFLYNHLPMYQRVGTAAYKKDLTNTLAFCAHLGDPQERFKSVLIAGTNGKGSSAHSIAAVCQVAGHKTGLYTSPHLKSFTERIKINGEEIEEEEVIRFVERNMDVIESIAPSFFEMTVAMAFDHFARHKVDIAIVEVGLGGRLDSTNILQPLVSLITNISLDHQQMLGETLVQIATEKAGIIKPGTPVVISEHQPQVAAVFQDTADQRGASISFASRELTVTRANGSDGTFAVEGARDQYLSLTTDLVARYHLKNIPGILKTLEVISEQGVKIETAHIEEGLSKVGSLTGFKGRWQVLSRNPLTICDAAHNVQGLSEVLGQLAHMEYEQLHIVLATVNDKDIDSLLEVFPVCARYYFCQADIPRALEAEKLAQNAAAFGLNGGVFENVNKALSAARKAAGENDLIFVGGSIFVLAEIHGI